MGAQKEAKYANIWYIDKKKWKKNEPNSAYGFDFDPTYNGWVLARVKAPYEPSMMRFEPEICLK